MIQLLTVVIWPTVVLAAVTIAASVALQMRARVDERLDRVEGKLTALEKDIDGVEALTRKVEAHVNSEVSERLDVFRQRLAELDALVRPSTAVTVRAVRRP